MTHPDPKCPVCKMSMVPGFILEKDHGGQMNAAQWAEGTPEKNFFGGVKTKDKVRMDIVSFRCRQCGWLVNFALDKH